VTSKGLTTEETSYFISSLSPKTKAKDFNKGIRGHWSVESFHYIKDVVLGEDKMKAKVKNAPTNYSLIRNVVINIFRKNKLESIKAGVEKCANNVKFMLSLI
jgi:predicted transposase YbfD/YdcC